jgi:D-alanyl-D-alanine carboxypeptidase (penicillin-binding protein 5/6)
MLSALMMVSANDAAYALACTVGHGSLAAFADDLNATARQLGLKESTLNDPSGLDDTTSFRGGPTMSAYDLATAARNALTVPAIARWAALHEYSFVDPQHNPHHFVNHNKMLPGGGFGYLGATGFKTGFTNAANHTLVATAERNGRTLIAVILGSGDSGYYEAGSLLDQGFAMPANAKGTGESVPDVAVSLYSARAADRNAFAQLGTAGAAAAATTPTGPVVTVPASVPVLNAVPRAAAPSPRAAGTPATTSASHSRGGRGFFSLSMRNIVIVLLLAAAVTFLLRRRAVRRRRSQRLARKRQRNAAMRSGGLPVVDGRYRTGLRLGQPVESHVRVHHADDRTA